MVVFYSVVFSLGNPKENKYIDMFHLMFDSLTRTGTFFHGRDRMIVATDAESKPLMEMLPVEFIVFDKPKTLLEGMCWKYKLPLTTEIRDTTCMYIDVDMLSIRRFDVDDFPSDRIAAYPEGLETDDNYCGDSPLDAPCGASAGFFVFNMGEKVEAMFKAILARAESWPVKFYTIEQPHFNHCLPKDTMWFEEYLVSFNGLYDMDTCLFVNCCGAPGNDQVHYEKMSNIHSVIFGSKSS